MINSPKIEIGFDDGPVPNGFVADTITLIKLEFLHDELETSKLWTHFISGSVTPFTQVECSTL